MRAGEVTVTELGALKLLWRHGRANPFEGQRRVRSPMSRPSTPLRPRGNVRPNSFEPAVGSVLRLPITRCG